MSDAKFEADAFAIQTEEWMKGCSKSRLCPGARIFGYIITLFKENER